MVSAWHTDRLSNEQGKYNRFRSLSFIPKVSKLVLCQGDTKEDKENVRRIRNDKIGEITREMKWMKERYKGKNSKYIKLR